MQRGCQPEQNACQKRQRDGEKQNTAIQADCLQTRQLFRAELTERVNGPLRQHDSSGAAHRRQQQAFRQQLTRDAPASAAHGRPHCHLPFSHRRPRQQQVRDVYTSDEQHQKHRAE